MYELVCGKSAADKAMRDKLMTAASGKAGTFAAVLAGALVSTFGWAPALAAVVAALVVKLFFKNAYVTTCDVWSKRLPASEEPPAKRPAAAKKPKKPAKKGHAKAKR